ncbi:MAG: hypothetical protein R3Y62_02600 [Eubacteriales bacterium]
MKQFLTILLTATLALTLVACGGETETVEVDEIQDEIQDEVAVSTAATEEKEEAPTQDDSALIAVTEAYMTAFAQNNLESVTNKMSPTVEPVVSASGDLLSIFLGTDQLADITQSKLVYFSRDSLDKLALILEYRPTGEVDTVFVNDDQAILTAEYQLVASDGSKEVAAPLTIEFDLIQAGDDWYLNDHPTFIATQDAVVLTQDDEVVDSFGTGRFTDQYTLDMSPYSGGSTAYVYALSEGYFTAPLSSIYDEEEADFIGIIDEAGILTGSIPAKHYVQSFIHDGAFLAKGDLEEGDDLYYLVQVDGTISYVFPQYAQIVYNAAPVPHLFVTITETSYEGDSTLVGLMDFQGNWLVEPTVDQEYLAMLPEDVDTSKLLNDSYNALETLILTYISPTAYMVDFSGSNFPGQSSSLRCIKLADAQEMVVDSLGTYTKITSDLCFTDDCSAIYYRGTSNFGDLYRLDLTTGDCQKLTDASLSLGSNFDYGMYLQSKFGYCTLDGEMVIDFADFPTMEDKSDMADFTYGYVPIVMNGYYTLLDTTGAFAFEPKEFGDTAYDAVALIEMISENTFYNKNLDTIESVQGEVLFEIPRESKVYFNVNQLFLDDGEHRYFIDETGQPKY